MGEMFSFIFVINHNIVVNIITTFLIYAIFPQKYFFKQNYCEIANIWSFRWNNILYQRYLLGMYSFPLSNSEIFLKHFRACSRNWNQRKFLSQLFWKLVKIIGTQNMYIKRNLYALSSQARFQNFRFIEHGRLYVFVEVWTG